MARVEIPFTVLTPTGEPKSGASVQVNVRGGGAATIWADETTTTTTLPNPISTNSEGRIEGWLDEGSYALTVSGAGISTYTQAWDAVSGSGVNNVADNAVGTAALQDDAVTGPKIGEAAVGVEHAADSLKRQLVPLGAVIDWYRPASSVPVPDGFVICDGATTLNDTQHDFGAGISFTVPDLRNKFILGASTDKADGTAAVDGDAITSAPGIRGTGASHARNLNHSHTVNNHDHNGSTGSSSPGTNSAGSHSHGGITNYSNSFTFAAGVNFGSQTYVPNGSQGAGGGWHAHGIQGDGSHSHTVNSHSHSIPGSAPGTNSQLSSAQDIKPQYYGLLKIMKVRRA